jgi:hypothetical protein
VLTGHRCIWFGLAAAEFADIAVGALHPFLLAVVDHGAVNGERDSNIGIGRRAHVGKGLERPSLHAHQPDGRKLDFESSPVF